MRQSLIFSRRNDNGVLTVEDIGNPGTGLVAHLSAEQTRRLRGALHDALREVGENTGR